MSSDVFFCNNLADNLHTQALLTQDTVTCLPSSRTPDRVRRSLFFDTSPVLDAYSRTPRLLIPPSTPSFSVPNPQKVFSPSPLPVSQVPSLVFPEISPPSQGSGSTPFERQFVGDFSREWDLVRHKVSPVLRRNLNPSLDFGPASQGPQDDVGRVSLIDKFISAAADESEITGANPSTFSSQDCFSPLSDLSDLTSLSSPDDFGCKFDLRSSSPPTSPTIEKLGQSNIENSGRFPNPGREFFSNQSTPSSSRSHDSDYKPAKGATGRKRKRTLKSRDGDKIPIRRKKRRLASPPEASSTGAGSLLGTFAQRRLPTNVPYHPQFPLLYLRFPASSYLRLADETFPLLSEDAKPPTGSYNAPREVLDLYAPRFVKGCGASKVGVCPICIESPSRGGKGEVTWLSMKFSAYKVVSFIGEILTRAFSYHLQYAHGISSVSGRPFSPPVSFRTIARQNPCKGERSSIQEGKCHKCKKWILVESVKDIDIKVKELYWWKHAASCHQGTHIDGDDDFFLDDEIYRRTEEELEL